MLLVEKIAEAMHDDLQNRLIPKAYDWKIVPWKYLDDEDKAETIVAAERTLQALNTDDPTATICAAYGAEVDSASGFYFAHLLRVAARVVEETK